MMMMNFAAITTEIGIVILMLVTLVMDLLLGRGKSRAPVAYVTAIGLCALLVYTFGLYHGDRSLTFFAQLFIVDNYAIFFKQVFIVGMIFTVLFSLDYARKCIHYQGEFYTLLLSALLGMCTLASANDFITSFVGLELMTVSFYALVGFRMDPTGTATSGEAAVKYLIFGAASSAVMLYGISLVYGATGSLVFAAMSRNIHLYYAAGLVGAVMVIVGFFFKLSVIPFHMWAPDVYEGAPTPVTALLAMGSKAAGIAVLMRVMYTAFPFIGYYWLPLIAIFSAICMIFGNIMAIHQTDVKRMLAYSSIAQAGYMMAGMAVANAAGMKAVMFYAMLYVFANVGAFAVLCVVDTERGGTDRRDITGLAQASPILAAVMTVSLLSMAGIPPTAGFSGKLYIFTAVVDGGYLWLAVVGFVMSMISAYYYLLVAKAMYRDLAAGEEWRAEPIAVPMLAKVTAAAAVIITLGIGIYPEILATMTNIASQTFMR